MSFPAVKEQRGVNSVNKYWTTGTVLGKIRPGRVNMGMGKTGGLSAVSGEPTMNFLKEGT